jgi:uncharacterized membrane protein
VRAGAVALVLAAAAGPTLAVGAESAAFLMGRSLVPGVEAVTGPICHHERARTPVVRWGGDRALPVCARCTGLYLGAAAGGLVGAAVPLRPRWIGRVAAVALGLTGLGLAAAVGEAAGLVATANGSRVGLGILLGLAVPLIGALGGRLIARGERPPLRSRPSRPSTG